MLMCFHTQTHVHKYTVVPHGENKIPIFPRRHLHTFIFKRGGNDQAVEMSESISQSQTRTETPMVCEADGNNREGEGER